MYKEEVKEFTKVEHRFIPESDRWVYIEYKDNVIIGLNWMQGYDYELFKKEWCYTNPGLTQFYQYQKGVGKVDSFYRELDQIIWTYFVALTEYDQHGDGRKPN